MDYGTVLVILGVSVIAGFTIVGTVKAWKQGPRLPDPAPIERSALATEIEAINRTLITMPDKTELIKRLIERTPDAKVDDA